MPLNMASTDRSTEFKISPPTRYKMKLVPSQQVHMYLEAESRLLFQKQKTRMVYMAVSFLPITAGILISRFKIKEAQFELHLSIKYIEMEIAFIPEVILYNKNVFNTDNMYSHRENIKNFENISNEIQI
uniref:Uncharacterized protein n=1 Tax=Glossina brevipalpis TaxID=37001 RepID=A0A1A9WWD2_9MUSC